MADAQYKKHENVGCHPNADSLSMVINRLHSLRKMQAQHDLEMGQMVEMIKSLNERVKELENDKSR